MVVWAPPAVIASTFSVMTLAEAYFKARKFKTNISRGIAVSYNFPFSWVAVNFISNPEKQWKISRREHSMYYTCVSPISQSSIMWWNGRKITSRNWMLLNHVHLPKHIHVSEQGPEKLRCSCCLVRGLCGWGFRNALSVVWDIYASTPVQRENIHLTCFGLYWTKPSNCIFLFLPYLIFYLLLPHYVFGENHVKRFM